jgi:hypothetical protein
LHDAERLGLHVHQYQLYVRELRVRELHDQAITTLRFAMGFAFSEVMSGTVEWDAEPGKTHPFRFEITARAGSLRDHLANGRAELSGIVHAPPRANGADAEGTILIRPLQQRIIRYELRFHGDDGRRYELVGQKDIEWLRPLATFTRLPAEIVDEDHRRVATCVARFDLRRDGWSWLRSFRRA